VLTFLWRDLWGNRGSRPLHLLATSLFLGVLLISACTGLLAMVRDGIASEERQLFGGDLELDVREPLEADALEWINQRGAVSRLTELRTMLGTEDDDFTVIELQSVDEHYPLYGTVSFEPAMTLLEATEDFGAAIDPVLAIDRGRHHFDGALINTGPTRSCIQCRCAWASGVGVSGNAGCHRAYHTHQFGGLRIPRAFGR